MDSVPDDEDLRVVVEEKYGLENAQKFLRKESRVLAHTAKKSDLASLFAKKSFGYEEIEDLKDELLNKVSQEKATAFLIGYDGTTEDLIQKLTELQGREDPIVDNKGLRVNELNVNDGRISVILSYKRKMATKRSLLNSTDEKASFTIESQDDNDDELRVATQEYRGRDEFSAVSDFFEEWRREQIASREEAVRRVDVSLTELQISDRVELIDDFLVEQHAAWELKYVLELGIRQEGESGEIIEEIEVDEFGVDEDMEGEINESVRKITNAVLKGRGLRRSEFVRDRVGDKEDFYFDSVRGIFDKEDSSEMLDLTVKFKQKPRPTFDVRINDAYELTDDGLTDLPISRERRIEIQDLFRDKIMTLYGEYADQPQLLREKFEDSLQDLSGVGPETAEELKEHGIEEPHDLADYTSEDIQEMDIDNVGKKKAEKLAGER